MYIIMCVCVDLVSLSQTCMIEVIESKLISVCLIIEHSLHIFVYGVMDALNSLPFHSNVQK